MGTGIEERLLEQGPDAVLLLTADGTIAFVNALAWVSHQQDHHPDLMVSYKLCAVSYTTHSAGGELSHNDFI